MSSDAQKLARGADADAARESEPLVPKVPIDAERAEVSTQTSPPHTGRLQGLFQKAGAASLAVVGNAGGTLKELGKKAVPKPMLKEQHQGRLVGYNHEALLEWRALFASQGVIFLQYRVYIVVVYVMCLMCITACAVLFLVPHARRLNTDAFGKFVTYIKVFIAFMLGLFLNSAFARWWSSVRSFKRFLTSIKQLLYTLQATEVNQNLYHQIERLALSSCYILDEEVHHSQAGLGVKQTALRWREHIEQWVDDGRLTKVEGQELMDKHKPGTGVTPRAKHYKGFGATPRGQHRESLGLMSMQIWTWIGEVMEEVRKEPNVADPMYVRLLFLCQDCMARVEDLKTNLKVQFPFTYCHMLALMVHIANFLLGISAGLAFGSAVAEIWARADEVGMQPGEPIGVIHGSKRVMSNFYEAWQVVGVQIVTVIVQPVIYQSFLVIAHSLCYPYGEELIHLPTSYFIELLEGEVEVMREQNFNKMARKKSKLIRKTTEYGEIWADEGGAAGAGAV